MKQAVITSFLGKLRDRFCEYQEPLSIEQKLERMTRIPGVSGAMNMFGNIGSFVSSVTFPLLLRWTGASDAYFYCAAAINLLAALLWVGMRERGADHRFPWSANRGAG